jgi:hypothetical protein
MVRRKALRFSTLRFTPYAVTVCFTSVWRKALRFSALPLSSSRLLSKDSAIFARDAVYSIFLIF